MFNASYFFLLISGCGDLEEPYPSLSDYHDYEPQLEFDDSEVIHAAAAVGIDDSFVGTCFHQLKTFNKKTNEYQKQEDC